MTTPWTTHARTDPSTAWVTGHLDWIRLGHGEVTEEFRVGVAQHMHDFKVTLYMYSPGQGGQPRILGWRGHRLGWVRLG